MTSRSSNTQQSDSSINQLPTVFKRKGILNQLVKRGQKALIYSRHRHGKVQAYDVFKIKIRPDKSPFGKLIKGGERFPVEDNFGYWARCCPTLERAMEVFNRFENG